MSPRRIVEQVYLRGIGMIAICDHNTCENVDAVIKAAIDSPLIVLPGVEITTREEVHILGWFPSLANALAIQEVIYQHLPGENNPELFGYQPIVDEEGFVVSFNSRALIGATTLGLDDTIDLIHSHEGLAVAAHIDREGFGILGQLGFIPPKLPLDALEISHRLSLKQARSRYPEFAHYPMITSSDAHKPEEIGRGAISVNLSELSFEALKQRLEAWKMRKSL